MKLNGFSSGSDASENNCFVLRLSFCLPRKLKFLEALQCSASSDFLRWFSSSLQDESRSLFNSNCCKNQSKEIHVLFVISEP